MRTALAPSEVPIARTRGEVFDDLVLDAVDELDERFEGELGGVEFAVEDVPADTAPEFDPEVVADRGIPLGRLHRAGLGSMHRPVILLYRRPIEARALGREDRGDLVFAVVAELVAELLGRDIDEIDRALIGASGTGDGLADAALEAAALPLGQAAPDAEPLVVLECVLEALGTHLAAGADALGLRVEPPFSGKKASGSVCEHSARSCQLCSSGSPKISVSSVPAA